MHIPHKKKKITLLLSIIFSCSVLSAENCTPDQLFKEKINNFTPNIEIASMENMELINFEELTQKFPTLAVETEGLKFSIIELLNIETSSFLLKDGIETGNTQEIVNSSVMLASSFVPTIVDGMIEAFALSLDADPITMAIGAPIMVGLNIYNGVETDKTIEKQKQALLDANKIFKDRASHLKSALHAYRSAILGEDNSLITIDEGNVSKLVLDTLKKQINNTIITLTKDALNQRSLHTQKTSLLKDHALKESSVVSNNITLTLSNFRYFLDSQYSLHMYEYASKDKPYHLNQANYHYKTWPFVPWIDGLDGLTSVTTSPFQHVYRELAWLKKVYIPILDLTLDKLYVNNDTLYKVLKDSVEYQLTNPDYQEKLRIHYNTAINRKYAWIKFGSELLENLDLSSEKYLEASLWMERVLMPFIDPFIERSGIDKISINLNVESKIASVVNELMKSNIDIHNKESAYALIKADAASDSLPPSVMNAIDIAYTKALEDVNSLILHKPEVKPFDISPDTVKKVMNKLHDDINQGAFKREVNAALNKYSSDLLFYGFNNERQDIIDKFFVIAEKIASLQAAYNGHIIIALQKTEEKIKATTDEEEIVSALQELGRYLIDNYLAFYDSHDPITMSNRKQDASYITFGALPFARNDLKFMLDVINDEIETRLKTTRPPTLKPKHGECHPNEVECY